MRTIGTAGHVDHGKSTLVQALTGMHPDRLKEEQEREMTIDLGFAWMTLENGEELGIVDVPGHRDFIENMLAGVGSIDAVLFIIAADEGIMPQTREHLAILDLLEVPNGIIVITKTDLVDEEWLTLVEEEVDELIESTSLAGSQIVKVSVVKGTGIEELSEAISAAIDKSPAPLDSGRPRLSIDRVFTLTGFGTVVTGTLVGGSFTDGQEVEIQPGGADARIRNIQSHKSKRDIASPGGRVALNLSGINRSEIERGDTVVTPGQWKESRLIDARFQALGDLAHPLKHNQEVKFYHGASQRMARVRLIGEPSIDPGQVGWIQLVLSEPIVADRGDRFILRRPSPGATLGGGRIIDPHPTQRYRLKDRAPAQRLERLSAGDPEDLLLEYLQTKGPVTLGVAQAALEGQNVEAMIEALIKQGEIIPLGNLNLTTDSYMMTATAMARVRSKSTEILGAYHKEYPLRAGMPVQEYRTRMSLDPKWANAFLETAEAVSWLKHQRNLVSEPTHTPQLSSVQKDRVDRLLQLFKAQPFSTPSQKEILSIVDEEVLNFLTWSKELVSVGGGVFFSGSTYEVAAAAIRKNLENQGTITIAEVRDLFNTSRKYALALMEHFDEVGMTTRDGDVRRLAG